MKIVYILILFLLSCSNGNRVDVPVYFGHAKAKIDYEVHSMIVVNDGIEINVSYVGTNERNSWSLYVPEVIYVKYPKQIRLQLINNGSDGNDQIIKNKTLFINFDQIRSHFGSKKINVSLKNRDKNFFLALDL